MKVNLSENENKQDTIKILIAEDDFVSRRLMHKLLMPYGDCIIAENGKKAISEFNAAVKAKEPFGLVFLDIMMPEINGQDVLKAIRIKEKETFGSDRAVIIMTTSLSDPDNVIRAGRNRCNGYLVKPIIKKKLMEQLHTLGVL